ncbi:uncharacterized protein LOC112147502 isoform X2 [Oryzias melastigma]|uniref:uncharacterized protein LOC112147502 isoform X2 n=1 Tax=Oryzias melastigma TaxID=30732 RepID=UPI000CF83D2B|nr:uncharacterized protein LOC112147502 isoform X2 [Oryzias melastigma]
MEGDSEESDEDVQEEPTVLWERCFQQSIFVDLSEDESIHLSDLDNSLALHLSQVESVPSEHSIHLSGSAELSALDDSPSESSQSSSNCENVTEGKTGSSKLQMSPQRPNTLHNELPRKPECGESGENTSDEDQEDLPYDGDDGSPYFNQTTSSEENSDGGHTIHGSPDPPSIHKETNADEEESSPAAKVAEHCSDLTNINHLLLQHFSQEELLRSGRLIEAETLPEVSLLESVVDTVLSFSTHNDAAGLSKQTESSEERSDSKSNNESSEGKTEKEIDHPTSNASDREAPTTDSSNPSIQNVNADQLELDDNKEEKQRVPLMRTRSLGEIKYGQGKVHYRLPDFSKVAPKVKIPKAPSGAVKSVPPCSVHRAQSSPDILDVISRVLEDFVQPSETAYVFRHTPPAPMPPLEDDKLITKYTTGENQKDTLRQETKIQLLMEHEQHLVYPGSNDEDKEEEVTCVEKSLFHCFTPHLPLTESLCEQTGEKPDHESMKEEDSFLSNHLEDVQSDGERMTAELRDIISQFMQKTEEFKSNVTNMTVSTDEQQMILRSMMEAQDHLERKYISKKEEHRALEMQNYMGLSRNTGTFDPDRQLEGDIFRIGMNLEDIKEMIDKNVYEQMSVPHPSSTPTMKTAPFSTPSPPPPLHQEVGEGFQTMNCETDSQVEQEEEEEELKEMKNFSEVHSNEWIQSSEVIDDDIGLSSYSSRDIVEEPDVQRDSEEHRASVFQEVIDDSDVLTCLSGHTSESGGRRSAANSDLSPVGDQGDSLAVEVSFSSEAPADSDSHGLSEPSPPISCVSQTQRIISPETDSGFGSSYLTQSASGELNLLTGSEVTSGSDSEGSNPPTAIHYRINGRWSSPHACVQTQHCGVEELWLESKEPPLRMQGRELLVHHRSDPTPRTAMDPGDRGSPLPSCSCNSDAILALQSEVSQLKKDLEEGLVQLPHLAKKMDYLTSKYGRERQERRSKLKPHQAAASSRVRTSRRTLSELSSSQLRTEDWISSDMDSSESTGSVRTNSSDVLHHSPEGSRRAERQVHSLSEFQDKLHLTKHSRRGRRVENLNLQGEDSLFDQQRPKAATRSLDSKERWSLLSASTLRKPLLQVHCGSTSSLPASYKVREPQIQSVAVHRKRSTQSDTALLPTNVFFQRTSSPVTSRGSSKTSRCRGQKEVDMNKTLDQAIEVARSMKRTADRMAQRLSADLIKAQQHRKLHNMQPLGGRTHLGF